MEYYQEMKQLEQQLLKLDELNGTPKLNDLVKQLKNFLNDFDKKKIEAVWSIRNSIDPRPILTIFNNATALFNNVERLPSLSIGISNFSELISRFFLRRLTNNGTYVVKPLYSSLIGLDALYSDSNELDTNNSLLETFIRTQIKNPDLLRILTLFNEQKIPTCTFTRKTENSLYAIEQALKKRAN